MITGITIEDLKGIRERVKLDFRPITLLFGANSAGKSTFLVRLITPKVTSGNVAELYFWPKLLDRIIVAGNYVKQSGGIMRKSPRWGASMSHVALNNDPDAAPTEWKLLRRDALDRWFRKYIAENARNKPNSTPIEATI